MLLLTHCSENNDQEWQTSHFTGAITVADSIDSSGDYSGIELLVISRDSANAQADTVFYHKTDESGVFEGTLRYPRIGSYPFFVSRNGSRLASSSLLLGQEDTLKLTAELPGFNQTKKLESLEYTAMKTFDRVDRSFTRIMRFAQLGRVTQDTLPDIYRQWSEIYWEIHTDYNQTIAGNNAAVQSVRLLQGVNDSLLIERFESVWDQPGVAAAMIPVVTQVKSYTGGLLSANDYLKIAEQQIDRESTKFMIASTRFDIAYDSLNLELADKIFAYIKKEYKDVNQHKEWLSYHKPYLNELRPGNPFPSLKLSLFNSSETIELDSMKGAPIIVEVAMLNTQAYQNQIEEIALMHQLYSSLGVKMITIPLDDVKMLKDFHETIQPGWTFAASSRYTTNGLTDRLHIKNVPDRFLVDADGNIVKHYEYEEIDDLINEVVRYLPEQEN
jgi:glutathione peroxidase-family protein